MPIITGRQSGVFFPAYEVFHFSIFYIIIRGRRGCDHMVVEFTTINAISAYTTDVVSLNFDQGEVYNIM